MLDDEELPVKIMLGFIIAGALIGLFVGLNHAGIGGGILGLILGSIAGFFCWGAFCWVIDTFFT
jgi:uncharacterized membrane protein